MSIRPIDFNGMLQRTEDVAILKKNEDMKPILDQQNIQMQVQKNEQNNSSVVIEINKEEQLSNQADAKEEGRGPKYQASNKKKKKENDVVKKKEPSGHFDITI